MLRQQSAQVAKFMLLLEDAITRQIDRVVVLPLHGASLTWESVDAAISFIETYNQMDKVVKPLARFEIQIRYNNGDSIKGEFVDKDGAAAFLRTYQSPLRPAPDTTV